MAKFKCPICDTGIEVAEPVKPHQRLTCHNCYSQLAVYKHRGKHVLTCAFCKDAVVNPDNCEDCERRQERRKLLEEGRL